MIALAGKRVDDFPRNWDFPARNGVKASVVTDNKRNDKDEVMMKTLFFVEDIIL